MIFNWKEENILGRIGKKSLKWFGHVLRMGIERGQNYYNNKNQMADGNEIYEKQYGNKI